MNNETMVKAIETMVTALQAQSDAHTTPLAGRKFGYELGRRYARIFAADGASRSVYAFVDVATGDIYKPASWKAPAKGIRGNILRADYMKACGVFSVARAR